MISYQLVRSKRKTLSLQVLSDGTVLVRAPMRCGKSYIDSFVSSKEPWILKRLETVESYRVSQAAFRPAQLQELGFCGKTLRVVPGEGDSVKLDLQRMEITLPDASVEELLPALAKLYKKAGLPFLQQRTEHWAKIMGISYNSVRFSSALKRWGSCSSKGDIRITWMVLFAPLSAIDYILVHELSHRVHFDHSPDFWDLVARYCPGYKQEKQVLLDLSRTLYSQGWSKKYQ